MNLQFLDNAFKLFELQKELTKNQHTILINKTKKQPKLSYVSINIDIKVLVNITMYK